MFSSESVFTSTRIYIFGPATHFRGHQKKESISQNLVRYLIILTSVCVKLAQEMRRAVGLARLIREGTRVNWLIVMLAKINRLGIHMPHLNNGGEGLGRKGWKEYVTMLDQCAMELKRKLAPL